MYNKRTPGSTLYINLHDIYYGYKFKGTFDLEIIYSRMYSYRLRIHVLHEHVDSFSIN